VDENQAWERFKQSLAQQPTAAVAENVIAFEPKRKNNFMRIAAAVALVVIGGFTAYYFALFNKSETITLASANKVLIDTLPDGSIITLNKNSTLAYSKDFNTKTRNVTLSGEAFFNVAPTNKSLLKLPLMR
jgi:transmembrane sensor